jgi:hypothetical protein
VIIFSLLAYKAATVFLNKLDYDSNRW